MQRRPVVVAVYDPRWFMKTLELAKRRGIRYHLYYEPQAVPHSSIVYTDHEDIVRELIRREDLIVIYDPNRDCRMLEKAFLASMYVDQFDYIVVGIDVGKKLSYVVLGNDKLLLYGEGDIRTLERDLDYVSQCIPYTRMIVRIGLGPRAIEITNRLRTKYILEVELVDESKTTPGEILDGEIIQGMRQRGLRPHRDKDIYAAYRIALSKGVKLV